VLYEQGSIIKSRPPSTTGETMEYSQVKSPQEAGFSRRSVLACTAVSAAAVLGAIALSRRWSVEDLTGERTWLSVGELVGGDDKASELARRLAGAEVQVRGSEFPSSKRNGDIDLHHRVPLPCGGCGLLHAPGVKLILVGADRSPIPFSRTTWAGRLGIASDGWAFLEVTPSTESGPIAPSRDKLKQIAAILEGVTGSYGFSLCGFLFMAQWPPSDIAPLDPFLF
jgi:hypothetical protein